MPKSGLKTTEFWVMAVLVLLQLLGLALGYIEDPRLSMIATTVLVSAYSVARGLAKMRGVEIPPALEKPPGSG